MSRAGTGGVGRRLSLGKASLRYGRAFWSAADGRNRPLSPAFYGRLGSRSWAGVASPGGRVQVRRMQSLAQVTDASFRREILEAGVPVLVDFWAPWCAYCKAMAPVVAQVAAEFGARLKVVGVNADEHAAVAAHFGVRGLPTFLVVKDGRVAEQVVGAVSKAKLRQAVERALAS